MLIQEVSDKRTIKEFLKVPNIIYENDDNWLCPLDMEIKKITPYYGFTLEDIISEEIFNDYQIVWPHDHTVYSLSTLHIGPFIGRFNECIIEIPQLLKIADK